MQDHNDIKNMYESSDRIKLYTKLPNIEEGLEAEELELVKRYFKDTGSILDIGCGAGREAFALEELGFKVTGIDLSDKMINLALKLKQDSGSNVEFTAGNILEKEYQAGSFDYVIMWNQMFENIIQKDDRIELLKYLRMLLNSEGSISFSVFHDRYSLSNLFKVIGLKSFTFRRKISAIKNYIIWKLTYRLSRINLFFTNKYMFRSRLIYISKKGRFRTRYNPGSVIAHIHKYSEILEELSSAGFTRFEILPYEELRFESDRTWFEKSSPLLYIVVYKDK